MQAIDSWPIRCLIAIALATTWGCGGDSPSTAGGPTFQQQYQAALLETNDDARARRLTALAVEQQKGQDTAGAKQSLTDAAKAAALVKDPLAKASLYAYLASVQADLGNPLDAGRSLKTAQEAAGSIENLESRAQTLCEIAEVQGGRLKLKNDASDTLDQAEALIAEITDPRGRAFVLGSVAKACAAAELNKQAQRVIDSALTEAHNATDAQVRADALAAIAGAQLAIKQQEAALTTLDEALAAAQETEKVQQRVYTLAEIATQFSHAGQGNRAQQLIADAIALTDQITDPDQQKIARTYLQEQREKL